MSNCEHDTPGYAAMAEMILNERGRAHTLSQQVERLREGLERIAHGFWPISGKDPKDIARATLDALNAGEER